MESIKTSKTVSHHCRLNSCGALTYRCKNQCKDCKEAEFEHVVRNVSSINQKLKLKGFELKEIDEFWTKIISLIPKIKEVGVENIKICTGCGHLNIEELRPTALACCPDNHYVNIKDKK